MRTLNVDGSVADPVEDAYDHSCVLLALAHAHLCGNPDALRLGEETFAFLDAHLEDGAAGGYLETPTARSDAAFQPAYASARSFPRLALGDRRRQPSAVAPQGSSTCSRSHFFDAESWTLGEFFDDELAAGSRRDGHVDRARPSFRMGLAAGRFCAEERPARD